MKSITLNNIVRETLMDMQYPLHYYVRFMHYGIHCLEELSYDLPFGESGSIAAGSTAATVSNIRYIELDVTTYMRAILPSDCVDVVEVHARYGEHVLPLRKDKSLNLIQNYDSSNNKIQYTDQNKGLDAADLLGTTTSAQGRVNQYGEHIGRVFGHVDRQDQSYNIDENAGELVFNNALNVNKVVVAYITNGVKTSQANVVHPYAKDTIKKYIIYQKHLHTNNAFNKTGAFKREYSLAKKKLKSRLYGMSYSDILAVLRQGLHSAPKN